jgi:hypothetical protein
MLKQHIFVGGGNGSTVENCVPSGFQCDADQHVDQKREDVLTLGKFPVAID